MDPITQQLALASAGASLGDPVYVDDVFSTHLYEGNGATQTITNGIDLSGEGGLVWLKSRTNGATHKLVDTARGVQPILKTNNTDAATSDPDAVTAFNSDGFNLGGDTSTNFNGADHVSWTFRKAPGFVDVVTWTGNGTDNRALSHSLGSTPGFIAVKATSTTGNWICWHKNLSASYSVLLNSNNAQQGYSRISNIGASSFSVRDIDSFIGSTNASGVSYVAYLFADNDQRFGTNRDEAIIKCGSYTGNANSGPSVDLGFEPQWLLIKNISSSSSYSNWHVYDMMRGVVAGDDDVALAANRTDNEDSTYTNTSSGRNHIEFTSTGFKPSNVGYTVTNATGDTYIYIAIRRPHKPPTVGTDVFDVNVETEVRSTSGWTSLSGFVTDAFINSRNLTSERYTRISARLTMGNFLYPDLAQNESTTNYYGYQTNDGIKEGRSTLSSSNERHIDYHFRRAPGFFDVVTFTGTGNNLNVTHNLGVKPELMLVKNRSSSSYSWRVYSEVTDATDYLLLTSNSARADLSSIWNDTEPTSSVFTVGTNGGSNGNGNRMIAYLFASLEGISKVGSYTGDGGNNNHQYISGFTAQPRFVLIKSISHSGDWMVFDSDRGITSGNDPFFDLNNTTAEQTGTNMIHAFAAGGGNDGGFTPFGVANTSGTTYLYLAIT